MFSKKMIEEQANRVVNLHNISTSDLKTLTLTDFYGAVKKI